MGNRIRLFDIIVIGREETKMSNQMEFQRKLAALLESAQAQNMRISKDEINSCFAEEHLNEEQMLLVYDYLLSQKIIVTGYIKNAKEAGLTAKGIEESAEDAKSLSGHTAGKTDAGARYSAEEQAYLADYERDLQAMKVIAEEEKALLLHAAAEGDAMAKSRLTEEYLPTVLEIAKEMYVSDMHIGDLVQEGNVSLLLALDMLGDVAETAGFGETDDMPADTFFAKADLFLRTEIRQGIQAMIEEQREWKRRDDKMAQQVNDLDEALHKAADEKGRALTLDELAEYVQVSTDEILDIMKLAGEDLYDKYKEEKE